MRSNSGRDESRNNMRDPTMRDREGETNEAKKGGLTTEMGSNTRKSGQEGDASRH